MLKEKGAHIIFRLHRAGLKKYVQMLPYIDEICLKKEPLPNFDMYAMMMDIPGLFGTTMNTIPADIPYLKVDESLVSFWKEKLSKDKEFKVGICLHGESDSEVGNFSGNNFVSDKRSVPEELYPYLNSIIKEMKNVSFYSLEAFFSYGKMLNVHEFDKTFDKKNGSFMDTAAVMKNMDLIITVDTSVAHIAGGLGVPVWVLLTFHPDWRWFTGRNDSPWYPNAKLFRQPKTGCWKPVIDDVKNELKKISKKGK